VLRRRRVAITLDWLALILALTAVTTAWTGGFYTEIGGVRVSMRDPARALLLAAIVFALRWFSSSGIVPFGVERERWQRWRARLYQPSADPVDPPVRDWRARAFGIAGILLFGSVLLHRQLDRMDAVPDLGDPLFSIWRMGWLFHKLQGDPRPLFDGNIFYPAPLTLTLSDSMLLPSLTAAPLLAAGMHPVYTYNVLFLSGFIFSAIATFLLVHQISGSSRAAFISALIYGFYPYRFEHYSHLELQMTQWMPLALLWLHRFVRSWRVRDALVAALCGVAQLYSSMYYGLFFSLYATAVLGTLVLIARPGWRRLLVPVAAAVTVGVALTIPLARPYFAAQVMKGERDEGAVMFYSAGPSDYFRPHPRSATYGGRLLADIHPERALFPGTTPLVLTAAALIPPIGATRLAYAAGLVTAFDISLGLKGVIYPRLYALLLPFRGMRVPARMSVVMAISLAVLAGFGVRRLLARFKSQYVKSAVFGALVLSAAIDFRPALDLQRVWLQPPPLYGPLVGNRQAVLAEFPNHITVPGVTDDVPYLYFSLWHWTTMVNGYSGFTPRSYPVYLKSVADFPGPTSIATLRSYGVTHVTINCRLMPEGCGALLEAADGTPVLRLITSSRWEGQPVRLYELLR
jgi:hypothetical protein